MLRFHAFPNDMEQTLTPPRLSSLASPLDALRRRAAAMMTWRHILLWYGISLAVGAFGTFAAYRLPGSWAWDSWSTGRYPWAVDSLRLLICTTFALFTIWNLGLLERRNAKLAETVLAGWRVAIPILVPIAAIATAVGIGSQQFMTGLAERGHAPPYDPLSIWFPYIPYTLYATALWAGMGVPAFAMLLTRYSHDTSMRRESRAALYAQFRTLRSADAADAAAEFQQSEIALQNYVARLKQIGERYIPVFLTVSALLIYEHETPSFRTYTPLVQDIGKLGLWLFLGPAVVAVLTVVTIGFQSAIQRAERAYSQLLERLPASQPDVRGKVLAARERLLWQSSSSTFILSIMKSATVFVLLVTAVTLYVLENIEAQNRLTLFVPKMILDVVSQIFS